MVVVLLFGLTAFRDGLAHFRKRIFPSCFQPVGNGRVVVNSGVCHRYREFNAAKAFFRDLVWFFVFAVVLEFLAEVAQSVACQIFDGLLVSVLPILEYPCSKLHGGDDYGVSPRGDGETNSLT